MGDIPARTTALRQIAAAVRGCTACRLHVRRIRAVPGEGPHDAPVFLIGEAPGAREDAAGRPFVGPAGGILDRALAGSRLRREDVFITNIVKCRPPGNRTPKADEREACRPYLWGQIAAVRPRVLVTLGSTALRCILGPTADLPDVRGKVFAFRAIPVIPTYHPAAILYNRSLERLLRADLRKAARFVAERSPRTRTLQSTRSSGGMHGPSRAATRSGRRRG